MDYSKMSDFEINKAVTRICYPTSSDFQNGEGESIWFRCGRYNDHKDYCNNPADAWPIIVDKQISTMWMTAEKEWCAWAQGDLEEGSWCWENVPDYYFCCQSSLRAAMIVFLKMQESANVQDNPAR